MIPQSTIIISIILVIIGLAELALGIFILVKRKWSELVFSFFLLNIGIASWVFSNAFFPLWEDKVLFFDSLTYLSAVVIACSMLLFSILFPFKKREISVSEKILIFLPLVFFAYIFIYDKETFFRGGPILRSFGYDVEVHGLFNLFNIFFLFFLIWAVVNFYRKIKNTDGLYYSQLKQILFAVSLAGFFGVLTNLFLPWLLDNVNYYWVGPMFSIVWFSICVKQITRKN